ncbi:MAG TPA: dihydroorotate dehydrogenase electron transfer subunit [Dermatophilaceae bacterium]|nr:dihydroorotate dehydrogenase electron transfer subunit [Dermatophilaceae bacterium]
MTAPTPPTPPVAQVLGRVLDSRVSGAYSALRLAAPDVAGPARPGQFVALAVGGPASATLLRRCFSLHRATPAGAVDLVVAPKGPGTRWLADLRVGDVVDVVGPLGRPFPLPDEPVPCVLVGGGYGSAPLFWLAEALRERGCAVHVVLGAASADRLFGVAEAERTCDAVTVTTDDGSAGRRGRVSDPLGEVLAASGAGLVYACGPMAMLASVSRITAEHGATAHVAVEESMACGIGVCMTCVLPVVGDDGATRMVRSCVEGPVLRGDRVRWDAFADGICRVPPDAVGAPAGGGHG